VQTICQEALRTMVNDTTVNIISDALIFRFALGILLGSYYAF